MKTTSLLLLLGAAGAAFAGCGSDEVIANSDTANATETILDGTPDAVGVLSLLNDGETTFELLDEDVPLPSHAATDLIAHRDGPDGVYGTSDDDRYDDIPEVLGVRNVGPARLQALLDFARADGWVPEGEDPLGVYDDVAFTVDEAAATVALVNGASFELLDVTIGLDRRAAESIVAAVPIQTALELSQLYYVGTSALLELKGWATAGTVPSEGDDCTNETGCATGLSCQGIPFDGSPQIGKCADTSSLPGHGDDCGTQLGGCGEGLECVGTTVYGGEGFCRPLWMVGSFASTESLPIADDFAAGVSADVVVYGLATVPEDIVVTLHIDHPRPADLHVELVSANGSSTVLWNHESNPASRTAETWGIERDNFVNGTWTLKVVDSVAGETGTLHGFELLVSSRYD